tara:strand:- start:39539 stop:39757 length:219 start_codon:yes stop_codon:yes gene_type:complete
MPASGSSLKASLLPQKRHGACSFNPSTCAPKQPFNRSEAGVISLNYLDAGSVQYSLAETIAFLLRRLQTENV